jgi:hypothetical protein
MLVFPQLVTGASSLYPLKKRHRTRTVMNVLGDGRKVAYEDIGAGTVEWELHLTGMTRSEADAIEALFQAVSGRWETFTFLDPAGNLLAHSHDFGNTVWSNGPLIHLTTGIDDPFGGALATRAANVGQSSQSIAQILAVPGNYQYSVSLWARLRGASAVSLTASSGTAQTAFPMALDGTWRRFSVPVGLGQSNTSVTFGVAISAGASVDIYGMQVEAQAGASDYKPTAAQGGVYTSARFGSDALTIKAQGVDIYDAVIPIVAVEN